MAYDIPSISDLEATQLLNKHYAEVITSKKDGIASGSNITQTTNPITGVTRRTLYKILDDAQAEHDAQIAAHETEHDAQMQSFENDFDGRLAGMAFSRVGSFTTGATLTDMRQVLVWEVSQGGDGHEYGWVGAFPKVVAAGATPATSGGIGAGAWVDRSDVVLRGALAGDGGAGLVGFLGGDPDLFAARTVADTLKGSMRFDDFKGSTDNEKWANMVAYSSVSIVTSISVVFGPRVHSFSSAPTQLAKPFTFLGSGARNTILKFTGCDGVSADLSAYGSRYIQSKIAHMSLVADSSNSNTGIYFKGAQSFAPHDPSLILDNVSLFGLHDIDNTAPTSTEWSKAVHLFDADEVHFSNVYICGADSNSSYSSRTTSKAIYADTVTGLRLNTTNIYLCGTGLEVTGQSEGFIGDGITIVAVDTGVLFRDLINPSNNHVLSNSHIAAYTKGVEFSKNANIANHPTAVYLSNLFILEREGNASKPSYVAIKAYVIRSAFDAITIQSNTANTPNRSAVVISNQVNTLSNIIGYHPGTLLYIDPVDTAYVYYNFVRGRGDIQAEIAGGNEYAIGAGLGSTGNSTAYVIRAEKIENVADSFRNLDSLNRGQYESQGGRHLFGGGRHNPNVYLDFRTTAGVTSTYDGRLFFTGGTPGVDGQADAYLYSKMTRFGGNIGTVVTNVGTCGTAGSTWAGGFTQTAFTVTSDENYKTAPLEITDAMLDAAAEVDWVQYQYLDRVEAKGADGARWHFGAVAQRYVEAFQRHGLDPFRFAFICYDEWDAKDAVLDEDGNVATEAVEAGSRYGIRYEEALALEAALQRRRCARIEARLAAAGL